MTKLWQIADDLSPLAEAYTVGNDPILDMLLLPYDLAGTEAHAAMLVKAGVLKTGEYKQISKALGEIKALHQKGKFKISPEQEDGHTAIEQYITDKLGDIGKKTHTGRSRNDQALVMIRLYMKTVLESLEEQTGKLSETFADKAAKTQDIQMPGYTHMQKAMPTTVGIWLGAYGDAFADLVPVVRSSLDLVDQNPLGSAAGLGTPGLDLDKEHTTQLLGFKNTQSNPMYAGLSRGYFELAVLQVCELLMTLAGRFACDMLLFTTQEFGYFSLPSKFTTGSSIMPNKRNYDIFEIMRGKSKLAASYASQVQAVTCGLGSGYQRDLALTKEPLVKGVALAIDTVHLLINVIPEIKVHEAKLKAAMTDELYATEKVYELVAEGLPFRDAYKKIKRQLFP